MHPQPQKITTKYDVQRQRLALINRLWHPKPSQLNQSASSQASRAVAMARGQAKAESRSGDNNLAVRKRQPKKEKKAKDPNKPKRPASAFLVFMEGFRNTFKAENPGNKSVAVVGKAGGEKWKSLTDEERAPFTTEAAARKQEYDCKIQAYNRKLEGGNSDESEKSKSEVHDDEASGEDEDDD